MPKIIKSLLLNVAEMCEGTVLHSDLIVGEHDGTIELPEKLTVVGCIRMSGAKIRRFPDKLKVTGGIDFSFTKIISIPYNSSSQDCDLDISNTPLKELQNWTLVKGHLKCNDTKLKELPANFTVGLSLDISSTKVKRIPTSSTTIVGQMLIARHCKNITSFVPSKFIGGYDFSHGALASIEGDKCKVKLSLILADNPIKQLPINMDIGLDLDISNTNIEALPNKIKIGGSLYAQFSELQHMPDGMSIYGDCNLAGTKMTALPKGLSVGGILNVRDTQITIIPEDCTAKEIIQ